MKIGLINLITKTANLSGGVSSVISTESLAPSSDRNLNITELAGRIAQLGNEVQVLIAQDYQPRETIYERGNPCVKYLSTSLRLFFPPSIMPFCPSLSKMIKGENFEIVQSGELFQMSTLQGWLASKSPGTRFFIWQELDIFMRGALGRSQRAFYQTLGRAIRKPPTTFIPRSLSARQHLIDSGIPEGSIAPVVHSGVDCAHFRPLDKESCREHLGIDGEAKVMLAIGRLDPAKGFDRIIQTVMLMRKEIPDLKLVIKGDGPSYADLQSLVKRFDLQDSVRFIRGQIPYEDMPKLYGAADLVMVMSRADLFPFVAIEAIACGIPLVSSFGRGLKSDILLKGAGWEISENPDKAARRLTGLLQDENGLKEHGRTARRTAIEDFDYQVCAARLQRIYQGAG